MLSARARLCFGAILTATLLLGAYAYAKWGEPLEYHPPERVLFERSYALESGQMILDPADACEAWTGPLEGLAQPEPFEAMVEELATLAGWSSEARAQLVENIDCEELPCLLFTHPADWQGKSFETGLAILAERGRFEGGYALHLFGDGSWWQPESYQTLPIPNLEQLRLNGIGQSVHAEASVLTWLPDDAARDPVLRARLDYRIRVHLLQSANEPPRDWLEGIYDVELARTFGAVPELPPTSWRASWVSGPNGSHDGGWSLWEIGQQGYPGSTTHQTSMLSIMQRGCAPQPPAPEEQAAKLSAAMRATGIAPFEIDCSESPCLVHVFGADTIDLLVLPLNRAMGHGNVDQLLHVVEFTLPDGRVEGLASTAFIPLYEPSTPETLALQMRTLMRLRSRALQHARAIQGPPAERVHERWRAAPMQAMGPHVSEDCELAVERELGSTEFRVRLACDATHEVLVEGWYMGELDKGELTDFRHSLGGNWTSSFELPKLKLTLDESRHGTLLIDEGELSFALSPT